MPLCVCTSKTKIFNDFRQHLGNKVNKKRNVKYYRNPLKYIMLLNNIQNMFSFLRVSPQTLLQLKLNLTSVLVPYEYEVIDSDLAFFLSLRNVNKLKVVAVQKAPFRCGRC